jgi:acyl carrier protein
MEFTEVSKKEEIINKFGLECSIDESLKSIIEQAARPVIVETLGLECEFGMSSHIIDDLGADSLDHQEVIMLLEDRFGVDISDANYHEFTKFGEIVDAITAKIKEKITSS